MDKTDKAVELFTKHELIDLAQGLGINKAQENYEPHVLVDLIRIQIEEENKTLDSKLFDKFQKIFEFVTKEVKEIPECYEFANDLDEACHHCFLYRNCVQELLDNLPNCFGLLYNSKLCNDCILKNSCSIKCEEIKNDSQYEIYLFQNVSMLTNILNALSRFRHYYQAWPTVTLIQKSNRYYDIKIRNLKKKTDYQVWKDAFYFSTNVEPDENIERIPLTLKGKRKPC